MDLKHRKYCLWSIDGQKYLEPISEEYLAVSTGKYPPRETWFWDKGKIPEEWGLAKIAPERKDYAWCVKP